MGKDELGFGLRGVIDAVLVALEEGGDGVTGGDELDAILDGAMQCCAERSRFMGKKCSKLAAKGRCDRWLKKKKDGKVVDRRNVKNHCPVSCGHCSHRCSNDASFQFKAIIGGET